MKRLAAARTPPTASGSSEPPDPPDCPTARPTRLPDRPTRQTARPPDPPDCPTARPTRPPDPPDCAAPQTALPRLLRRVRSSGRSHRASNSHNCVLGRKYDATEDADIRLCTFGTHPRALPAGSHEPAKRTPPTATGSSDPPDPHERPTRQTARPARPPDPPDRPTRQTARPARPRCSLSCCAEYALVVAPTSPATATTAYSAGNTTPRPTPTSDHARSGYTREHRG